MPTLHTWNTPNGKKPAILLEELGIDYQLRPVDLGKKANKSPEYLALNPQGKIPLLTDGSLRIFESGAILLHLARSHDRFLPHDTQACADALAWSYWQTGSLSPAMAQWVRAWKSGASDQASELLKEPLRLFGLLEKQLASNPYVAGAEYSIADIMLFPWVTGALGFLRSGAKDELPTLNATGEWLDRVGQRPAVQSAIARLDAISS